MVDEPSQETPEGATIPVPKRADVLRDLRKVAKADKPPSDSDTAVEDASHEGRPASD